MSNPLFALARRKVKGAISAKITANPVVQDPTLQAWIKQVSTEVSAASRLYAKKQDLANAGVISVDNGVIQPPTGTTDENTTFIPLAVTNLYAGGAYTSVTLTWDQAESKYFGLNEVFRSQLNDFGTAVKIGTTTAKVYTDYIGNDAKVYYWVRAISRHGVEGEIAPPVYAETAKSFEYIKDIIVGQIEQSWITQEFNNVLNGFKESIDDNVFNLSQTQKDLTKLIGDAKTSLTDAIIETERRANAAIDQAKMLLSQSITSEIDKTNTLLENKTNELKNADIAQASTTNKLAVQMRGGYDGNDLDQVSSGLIYQHKQTTTTALETLSRQLSLVSASGNNEFDSGVIYFFDEGAESWINSTGAAAEVSDGWIKLGNKPESWTITSSAFKNDLIASKYNEIRLRIRQIGEPAKDLVVSVQDSFGNVQSRVVGQESYAYDQIGSVTISLKPQWTVQSINKISISRASATSYSAVDYFEIDWVAIGRPSPAASYSAVSEEIIARVKGDEVNNTKIESFYSELKNENTNINARIDDETTTRVTNDEAITKRVGNAETSIGNNKSNIGTLQQNVTDLKQSTALSVENLNSKFDNMKIGSNNLVRNSSLEKDMNGWLMNLPANYSFVDDPTLPSGKSKCLKFISTGYGSGWYQTVHNLKTGDEFTFSIWAKGETGTEELWMSLEGHDKNKFITLTKDWKRYSFTAILQFNYSNPAIYARNIGTFYVSCVQYERGNITTDWKPNASETQANLDSFKETYTSAEEARTTQITQMDSKFTKAVNDTNTALSDTDLIARAMTSSKLVGVDPSFRKGLNNVEYYNNAWTGRNIIERVLKDADNPTTSTHQLNVTVTNGANPYYGGFYQLYYSRPNAIFVVKYIMKIPIGYMIVPMANSMGDGATDRIIGNSLGTGKYETYYRLTKCGSTGYFNNFGHLALGNVNEEMLIGTQTMTFPLASIECYDLTDYADMTPAVQESFASINESLNTLTTADAATASKILQLQANYDASSPNMRMPNIRDENLGGQWTFLICHVPNGLDVNNPIPYSAINTAKFIRKGTCLPSTNYNEDSHIHEEYSLTMFRCFVYVSQAKSLVFQNATIDDAVTIYVNETQQYHKSIYGIEPTLTLNLVAGWNKFDVLIFNGASGGELTLNPSLASQVEHLYPVRPSDILDHTGATALSNYITIENAESTMAGKIEEFNVSSGLKGIRNYVLYSGGLEATQGGAGYIRNLANNEVVYVGRSYMLVVFDAAGNIQSALSYDVFGGYVDGFNTAVANLPTGTRVAVITSDEPLNNKSLIRNAILSLGGTAQKFDSMITHRGAYLLVGCKNAGNTYGVIELVSNDKYEGLEYGLTLGNGKLFGLNTSSALSQYLTKSDTESTISGKFEEFSTTVSNQVKADLTTQTITILDLRHPSYGRDTWYPVTIGLTTSAVRYHIEISSRLYANESDAAWITHGTKTFSCQYTWEVSASGWGANPVDRQIISAEYLWATHHPVIGMGQTLQDSTEVVYVRGGGVYDVSSHKSSNVTLIGDAGTTLPNSGQRIIPLLYNPDFVINSDKGTLTTKITETTQVVDGIKAIKSVFIDNNGVASGYATTSELINGQVRSTFGVYANTFFVADPANPNSRAYPLIIYNGQVVMDGAIIRDASITNAKIGNLAADKITSGDISSARMTAGIVEAARGKFDYLSSLSAKIGYLESASSGQRFVLSTNGLAFYAANGVAVIELALT